MDHEIYKGYRISIVQDEHAENPRSEWSNFGRMLAFGRHSHHSDDKADDFGKELFRALWSTKVIPTRSQMIDAVMRSDNRPSMVEILDGVPSDFFYDLDYSMDEKGVAEKVYEICHDVIAVHGLEFYERSHTHVSHDKLNYDCDGFIYATLEDSIKNWMLPEDSTWETMVSYPDGTQKTLKQRALDLLECEIETYKMYLEGDVWGYEIRQLPSEEDEDEDDMEVIESCWGFFGLDYCLSEARSVVDALASKKTESTVRSS